MSIVSFFIYCSDRCFICCYTEATIICFIEFRKMIQWLARKSQIMMMMKSLAWRQVIFIANIATILLLQRQIPYPHWTNPKGLLEQRHPHLFDCLSKKGCWTMFMSWIRQTNFWAPKAKPKFFLHHSLEWTRVFPSGHGNKNNHDDTHGMEWEKWQKKYCLTQHFLPHIFHLISHSPHREILLKLNRHFNFPLMLTEDDVSFDILPCGQSNSLMQGNAL